jgi:hypothetical protein
MCTTARSQHNYLVIWHFTCSVIVEDMYQITYVSRLEGQQPKLGRPTLTRILAKHFFVTITEIWLIEASDLLCCCEAYRLYL